VLDCGSNKATSRVVPRIIARGCCAGSGTRWFCYRRNTSSHVKRGKNDANDAEAICEAMSRPGMRFVPIKSAESQAELMLLGVRDLPADRAAPARSKPRRFSAVFRDRTIEHRDGAV
jgi:hypothetical protein